MVRLTMTQSMVSAIEYCSRNKVADWDLKPLDQEPSLRNPSLGQPITHGQVIALSQCLRKHLQSQTGGQNNKSKTGAVAYDLDGLLRGSKVYIEPPKPKKEPTTEFKALMARLREEEEARAYERMMNPPSQPEAFSHLFSASSKARLFPTTASKEEDDEITYADINRQVALIINVLVSIIACSIAIWMAARHWSTPLRLGLSMGGSGVVGVAEVVVYAGYLRRVKEAKEKEKSRPEVKEITETWVIDKKEKNEPIAAKAKLISPLRKRH